MSMSISEDVGADPGQAASNLPRPVPAGESIYIYIYTHRWFIVQRAQ